MYIPIVKGYRYLFSVKLYFTDAAARSKVVGWSKEGLLLTKFCPSETYPPPPPPPGVPKVCMRNFRKSLKIENVKSIIDRGEDTPPSPPKVCMEIFENQSKSISKVGIRSAQATFVRTERKPSSPSRSP